MKTLNELQVLWQDLGDAYFDDAENLEQSWLHFPEGTNKFDIWHWFEDQNPKFVIAKILYND